MDSIFVSIAAYRDKETKPTIEDLFSKAKYPENLTVGLCLQHETDPKEINIEATDQIKILEYNWRESQGACWARHNIQKLLFNNEKYYLQLDSHHRFCQNWDQILINLMNELKQQYEKPIIGGYCPGYTPEKDKELEDKPMQINCFSDFTEAGDLPFVPKTIRNYKELQKKNQNFIPARFLSGHFIFADGNFCHECLYDPGIYFRGEELSLSARAYTNGYDFFHPTIPIVWHEYLREKGIKHWDDHTKKNGFIVTSTDRSDKGKARARYLLGIENKKINFGKYSLGNKRSLHDYELYCGLKFSTKQIHKYAYDLNNVHPYAYKLSETEWQNGLMTKFKVNLEIPENYIQEIKNIPNLKHISLIADNNNNKSCYRKDIKFSDWHTVKSKYYIEASMESEPFKILLIPFSFTNGFLHKYNVQNFRIVK